MAPKRAQALGQNESRILVGLSRLKSQDSIRFLTSRRPCCFLECFAVSINIYHVDSYLVARRFLGNVGIASM